MMDIRRYLCLPLLSLAVCASSLAKEVKDTLKSPQGDRVILGYNMTQDGGLVTVKFGTVQKRLTVLHLLFLLREHIAIC